MMLIPHEFVTITSYKNGENNGVNNKLARISARILRLLQREGPNFDVWKRPEAHRELTRVRPQFIIESVCK